MESCAKKIFISYTHKDEEYLNSLKSHLAPLVRNELIDIWSDRDLIAGDELDASIVGELNQADIVICLISSDYINSYYCYEVELESAFKRITEDGIRVIPVIIRPCAWLETDLKSYLCAPKDGKAISTWSDSDTAFLDVVEHIKNAAKKVKKR